MVTSLAKSTIFIENGYSKKKGRVLRSDNREYCCIPGKEAKAELDRPSLIVRYRTVPTPPLPSIRATSRPNNMSNRFVPHYLLKNII